MGCASDRGLDPGMWGRPITHALTVLRALVPNHNPPVQACWRSLLACMHACLQGVPVGAGYGQLAVAVALYATWDVHVRMHASAVRPAVASMLGSRALPVVVIVDPYQSSAHWNRFGALIHHIAPVQPPPSNSCGCQGAK
jgi:hypothetical protein